MDAGQDLVKHQTAQGGFCPAVFLDAVVMGDIYSGLDVNQIGSVGDPGFVEVVKPGALALGPFPASG